MKKKLNCRFCGSDSYLERADYKGTTERYKEGMCCYARCGQCDSLNNLSLSNPDYGRYTTGTSISKLKVNRLIRLLRNLKVSKNDAILDYGCGNGALVKAMIRKGYLKSYGYEPFNPDYMALTFGERFKAIILTHVFEHIPEYSVFFSNLKRITTANSLIITIHPSSSRIKRLDSNCPFQTYALHAPCHTVIPSDKATISLFQQQGYKLKLHYHYDFQRSGFRDNNLVTSLLAQDLGGTTESWLNASKHKKMKAFISSPIAFLDKMFIHTKDRYSSTFVFEANSH